MRRLTCAVLLVLAACGSSSSGSTAHSAAERARDELAASGETSEPPPKGASWGGWRYQGARDDCFYVVGRKCFVEEATACKVAKCGKKKCKIDGGGPATVSCK
jgi:hypothetical protein